jgi:hypothetical protein
MDNMDMESGRIRRRWRWRQAERDEPGWMADEIQRWIRQQGSPDQFDYRTMMIQLMMISGTPLTVKSKPT